jgi:hypothetical protein
MARSTMGFDFGLDDENTCFKRKNRWLLIINEVSAEGINTLPPFKSARPSLSFKEIEAQHATEIIYFPGKPEWKPISLSLYDLKKPTHPVFEWLKKLYDPQQGTYSYSCTADGVGGFKKSEATLEVYDGCGNVIETWIFENAWPQSIEFGDLDMSQSEVLTCDLVLRYDRAYIKN